MRKTTSCTCENKDAVTAKLISAFVFNIQIVQFLLFLNQKFQASSLLLRLYRPVYVGPVRKPHCWFSHDLAQILFSRSGKIKKLSEMKQGDNSGWLSWGYSKLVKEPIGWSWKLLQGQGKEENKQEEQYVILEVIKVNCNYCDE